jgi:formamidopyrimidine-DNA glycosylase
MIELPEAAVLAKQINQFGCSGGYRTILSKNTVGKPYPICGTSIRKEAYLGGSIYIGEDCQTL